MSELELKVGRTYRAKKPGRAGTNFRPEVNDRTITWLGAYELQYDGPSVAFGRHYPKVTREKFLEWAAKDVTDELPEGEYATWPLPK